MSPTTTLKPQKKDRSSARSKPGWVFSKEAVRQAAEVASRRIGADVPLRDVPSREVVAELLRSRVSPQRVTRSDSRKLHRFVVKVLAPPPKTRGKTRGGTVVRSARIGAAVPAGHRVVVAATPSPPKESVALDAPVWQRSIGPVYLAAEVSELLGEPRHALSMRARQRSLLALRTSDGHTVYPAFQFVSQQVLPGLGAVLRQFPNDDEDLFWSIASWMRKPLTTLNDRSVVDVLSDGDIDAAVKAAHATASRWSR